MDTKGNTFRVAGVTGKRPQHLFPALAVALLALGACAPAPVLQAEACPPPVTGFAKDGTVITLSEPCVLPERFEVPETERAGAYAPFVDDGDGGTPGGPVTPPTPAFETKRDALKRVYGIPDWHNLDAEQTRVVKEFYQTHGADADWSDFGREPTPDADGALG